MKNLFLLFRKIYIKCNKTDTGYDLYGILRVTTIQIVKYKNNDKAHISTVIPLSVFTFVVGKGKKRKIIMTFLIPFQSSRAFVTFPYMDAT